MNFQVILDQLPLILAALALLLWACARVLEAYAKKDPAANEWDKRAETMRRVSEQYAQALEWMVTSGYVKWSGSEKLAELKKRVTEFESLWTEGRYIEALSNLSGFYQSALSKIQKVQAATLPFANPSLRATSPNPSPEPSGVPDSMENAVAVDSSAGPEHGEVK